MLDRFKKMIKTNNPEINKTSTNNEFNKNKDFKNYFESTDYRYLNNNTLIKEEYIHLLKIPETVIDSIEESVKNADNIMWNGIIQNKNKKSNSNDLVNIPLKSYWVKFNDLNLPQKEFYYHFREQALKGVFIKADLSYVFLFIYEGLYYQWSNYPGFVISLIIDVYNHYRQEPSYKYSLDNNVPLWINGLLLENNESKLAANYMFSVEHISFINKNPLLLCFAEGKKNFNIKKVEKLIEDYNDIKYKRHQKKINNIFVDLLFSYTKIENKTLFQLFVKKVAKEVDFSEKPFSNANCQRKISNTKGYKLFYDFKKDEISNILNDIYKLSYDILTDEGASLNYLSYKEINLLKNEYRNLLNFKEKENYYKKVISNNFGKTTINPYVDELLISNINNKNEEKNKPTVINSILSNILEKPLNYNNFLNMFKDECYNLKLSNIYLNETIPLKEIPDNLLKNYYDAVEILPKSHFFYQIMKYRTMLNTKTSDYYINDYKNILKQGIIYFHLLRPQQTDAYLYFRQELIKGNFVENVHFSFIQLFLSELFHLNITKNPQEIIGVIDFIKIKYFKSKGFNLLKIQLLTNTFLSECGLEIKNVEVKLKRNQVETFTINHFLSMDFDEIKTITPFKKYITIYNECKEKQTKTNNIFKELLPLYNQFKGNELKDYFIRNVREDFKTNQIYKDIMITREAPSVTYSEVMNKFDNNYFISFMNEFYLFIYCFVNEKNNDEIKYTHLSKEDLDYLLNYLNEKYNKPKKKTNKELKEEEEHLKLEEFKKNMFEFDFDEIENLKELHKIKEEKEIIKKEVKQKTIDISILNSFLEIFDNDELSLTIAEKFAKENNLSLNKLISETNKQLSSNISIEDDMLYND